MPVNEEVYFFGCWGEPGHYMWTPDRKSHHRFVYSNPWGTQIDSNLCPGERSPAGYMRSPENQGEALLHFKDGWTCLSFWDRTGDQRPGSNSNFLAKGQFSFEEMMALARLHFPALMDRFTFEIRLAK